MISKNQIFSKNLNFFPKIRHDPHITKVYFPKVCFPKCIFPKCIFTKYTQLVCLLSFACEHFLPAHIMTFYEWPILCF